MKKILLIVLFPIAFGPVTQAQVKNATDPGKKMGATERKSVIDTLIQKINTLYVYADLAKKMTAAIHSHLINHDYDTITDRATFAGRLTKDLYTISKDGHLGVDYTVVPAGPGNQGAPSEAEVNQFRSDWANHNFNFKKVELLDGNIGLLQLDSFFPGEWIKDLAAGSMTFLAHSDAIIIDLRKNHGFAPDGVQLIESYFFDEPVHLFDTFDRDARTMTQTWTLATVPGPKLVHKDLYILVSKNTFSAGEDFSYNMQSTGRAKIIGEVTGGGAHGTKLYKISTWFTAAIPFSYEVNQVTHTDWEGKGVQPDVPVPANQALLTAQLMAIQSIIRKIPAETERIAELQKVIAQKEQELNDLKAKK
jgi:hypothetical protein